MMNTQRKRTEILIDNDNFLLRVFIFIPNHSSLSFSKRAVNFSK